MIKLIYGSDTGNTEIVTGLLVALLVKDDIDIITVDELEDSHWDNDKFILGIPTWYDGELQSDWEDYFEEFKKIDFTGKSVAIFGLGDQVGYDEWFCDGIGILAEVVEKNGGKVIGNTVKDDSFDFESSKALKDENTFWGLCLDEDNQDELTEERLTSWVKQIKEEFKI